MQDAKTFCSNLIRILNFLLSVLSFLTVARAAMVGERRAAPVETKEITIGHSEISPLYAIGAAASVLGLLVTAVLLWRWYKGK